MESERRARLEARAAVIKAMSHPTRLLILEELEGGKRCVAELTANSGSDVSTVSKHLAVLRHAGIVQAQREGARVCYTLRVPCVLRFFDCIEAVLRATIEERMKGLEPGPTKGLEQGPRAGREAQAR